MPLDDLRALASELKLAGAAAAALAATLVLPWYEKSFVPAGSRTFVSQNVTAFGVFSWVEAAVLLVSAGVLYLVWARSQRRGFHLPGGDGVVISIAGGWALVLLVWRLFDKPDASGGGGAATVGIQWGIFGAMLAAAAVLAAGARIRATRVPEPPNPAADVEWEGPPIRASARPRRPGETATTLPLGERPPAWEGEPPAAPGEPRR